MKAVNELRLLPDTPFTEEGGGSAVYNPIIKGFSKEITVTNTPQGPSQEEYLQVNLQKYSTDSDYQHRAVLVEGYVRPIDIDDAQANPSKRIGLPFTHIAMLPPASLFHVWDIFIEEHTANSSIPISLFSIYNIEQCFGTVFTPSNHPVEYSNNTFTFKLKLLGGFNADKKYTVSGIYHSI